MGAPEYLIFAGCAVFVFVLWLSAYFQADIRWLHFFQAWMYLAAAWLTMRKNRWGWFIGISAAGLWDYTNLFVTTFFANGLHWLAAWVSTGRLRHADLIIAVPAWTANFAVVAGCIWAYARAEGKSWSDIGRLAAAFMLTTGFFAADMAICQPRYLPLLRGLLHPHSVF